MGKTPFFVLGITLQLLLSFALADESCAPYETDGKTCTLTDTGDGGFDCTCTKAVTVTNIVSELPAQFNIQGVGSGKCADVSGAGQNDNANVLIWNCLGGGHTNQVWSARPAPGGYYLVVKHSGKCLTNQGNNLVQSGCVDGPNQVWQFQNSNGKRSKITNPASGKCMDVSGNGKNDGANVIAWDCHGQENQLWNVNAV